MALRSLSSPPDHIRRYVQGQDSGRKSQREYEAKQADTLEELEEEMNVKKKELTKKRYSGPWRDAIQQRWAQIGKILEKAYENMEGG